MGACFDYRVYRTLYAKKKYCQQCKKKGNQIHMNERDGKRICMECDYSERIVRTKRTQEQVGRQWYDDVEVSLYCDGHLYSGTIGMLTGSINWQSRTFQTEDEALKYIQDNHEKWSRPMGVKFLKGHNYKTNRLTKDQAGCVIGGWCSS